MLDRSQEPGLESWWAVSREPSKGPFGTLVSKPAFISSLSRPVSGVRLPQTSSGNFPVDRNWRLPLCSLWSEVRWDPESPSSAPGPRGEADRGMSPSLPFPSFWRSSAYGHITPTSASVTVWSPSLLCVSFPNFPLPISTPVGPTLTLYDLLLT